MLLLFVLSFTCIEQSLHGSLLTTAQPMQAGRNRFVHFRKTFFTFFVVQFYLPFPSNKSQSKWTLTTETEACHNATADHQEASKRQKIKRDGVERFSFSAPLGSEQRRAPGIFSLCKWARTWSPVDVAGCIKNFKPVSFFLSWKVYFLMDVTWRFVIQLGSLPTMLCLWLPDAVLRSSGQWTPNVSKRSSLPSVRCLLCETSFHWFVGEEASCQGIKCLQTNYAHSLCCETSGVVEKVPKQKE